MYVEMYALLLDPEIYTCTSLAIDAYVSKDAYTYVFMYKNMFRNRHVLVSIILNLHYLQYMHVSILNRICV